MGYFGSSALMARLKLNHGLPGVPHALEVRLELGSGDGVVDHDKVIVLERSPLVLKFAEPVRSASPSIA